MGGDGSFVPVGVTDCRAALTAASRGFAAFRVLGHADGKLHHHG
jgi:hypothetical protein